MIEIQTNEDFDRFERALCCLDEADVDSDGRSPWPEGFKWSSWQLRYKSRQINWLHRVEVRGEGDPR